MSNEGYRGAERRRSFNHKVLFLCTGNSCRSQMAEGWLRHLAPGIEVASAGIEAHGLNDLAVDVMAEQGVDISKQSSDVVNDAQLSRAGLVITVCGDADERCPLLPAGVTKLHWPLPDPARLTGTAEQRLTGFREVRDDIRARIETLLAHELAQ